MAQRPLVLSDLREGGFDIVVGRMAEIELRAKQRDQRPHLPFHAFRVAQGFGVLAQGFGLLALA